MVDDDSPSQSASDPGAAVWRRPGRGDHERGPSVEVASVDRHVLIRSSDNPDGPLLCVPQESFSHFVLGVRAGELDDLIV